MRAQTDTPAGTRVRFYPGTRQGRSIVSHTRSAPWKLGCDWVVSIEGYAGGVAISHVDVLGPESPHIGFTGSMK